MKSNKIINIVVLLSLFVVLAFASSISPVYAWSSGGWGGDSGCCDGGGWGDGGYSDGPDGGDSSGIVFNWPSTPSCTLIGTPKPVSYGGTLTLKWTTNNAVSASIDNGIGAVQVGSGSITIPNMKNYTVYHMTVTSSTGSTSTCLFKATVDPEPEPSCSISANPSSVNYGGNTTLVWTTNNASSASIDGIGVVSTGTGSYAISNLTQSRSFTMRVLNTSGVERICTVTVDVDVVPEPSCSIWTDLSSIYEGERTTIRWQTNNAVRAYISGIGDVTVGSGAYVTSQIYDDKTYVMTVENSAGQTKTCSAVITVNNHYTPTPSCSLRAIPSTIDEGDDVTLVWSSSNAVSAEISDGIGTVALAGSRTLYNVYDSEYYVMTVRNASGEIATCSTSVVVNERDLSCNIYASPNPSTDGTTTLHWSSSNADWAIINNGIGSVSTDGSRTLTDLSNGTHVYTLTVGTSHSGGRTKTCSVTVNVNKTVAPSSAPSCSITASRTYLQKGEGTTLYWTSQNATSAIFADNGNVATSGSRVVYPTVSGYYKLIVTNQDGQQSTCETYITVENPTTVVTVSSVPYTGPNDALYVGLMTFVFGASVFGLYRRRNQVLELIRG